MPSILKEIKVYTLSTVVLNLIITGMPSIPGKNPLNKHSKPLSFKPYYNWNAFNTCLEEYQTIMNRLF